METLVGKKVAGDSLTGGVFAAQQAQRQIFTGYGYLMRYFDKCFDIYTNAASTSQVRVMLLGDSLASKVAGPLAYWIAGSAGYTLGGALGNGGACWSGGPIAPCGPTVGTSGSVVSRSLSTANPDYTQWITGTVYEVGVGGVARFPNNVVMARADTLDIYYVKSPGAGTFNVETSTDGTAWTTEATVDANAALAGAVYTVTKTLGRYYIRALGVTGTVKILGAGSWRNGVRGFVGMNVSAGGLSIIDMVTCPTAIVQPIMARLNPTLIMFQMDDPSTDMALYFATLKGRIELGATAVSWLVIGNGPKASGNGGDAASILQCDWFRANADVLGYAFFDLMVFGGSYTNLTTLGLNGDGLHLADKFYIPAASFIARQLNLIPEGFSRWPHGINHVYANPTTTEPLYARRFAVTYDPSFDVNTVPAAILETDATGGNDTFLKLGRTLFFQTSAGVSFAAFSANDAVFAHQLPPRWYMADAGTIGVPYTTPGTGGVGYSASSLFKWRRADTGEVCTLGGQTQEVFSGFIAAPTDKTYKIVVKCPHGGTITEITTICISGTATMTTKINTTAVTATANAVSGARDSKVPTAANVFVVGDDLQITISASSSCVDLSFSIKYTRTIS